MTVLQHAQQVTRFLAQGADEDDKFSVGGASIPENDDGLMWYQLETWVDSRSLAYDIIEGFLYVGDAFFIAWVLWGCLVHCGILPDERLDRRRRLRRLKDGRGVFSPIRNFDPLYSSDDDDDESRDSMEYGDPHEEDEYGDIDVQKEEEKIKKDAESFFQKGESRKSKDRKKKIDDAGPMEEGVLLLDFEMAGTPQNQPSADVIFL